MSKIETKNFRENNTEALVISKKNSSSPQNAGREDTNFKAPFIIHFEISKSTLDSLNSVFSVFRRKPSLGAPDLLYLGQLRPMRGNPTQCSIVDSTLWSL